MAIKYHQISLSETFSDCQNQFMDDSPSFFNILAEYFDLDVFILQNSHPLFILPSAGIVFILFMVFLPPISSRKYFLFLPIPCFFYS